MKKAVIFSVAALFFFVPSVVWAKTETIQYYVKLKAVRFLNTDGQWITLRADWEAVNLLGDKPLLQIYNDKGQLPLGTYTNIKVIISETVLVSGYDGDNNTQNEGEYVYSASPARIEDLPGDFYEVKIIKPSCNDGGEIGLITVHFDLDSHDRDDFMEIYPRRGLKRYVEIKKKSLLRIYLRPRSRNQLHYAWAGSLGPDQPAEDIMLLNPFVPEEMTVGVDAVTNSFDSDSLQMSY